MDYTPIRFIDAAITVTYERAPYLEKRPECPDRFEWQGEPFIIEKTLNEWIDYQRRGRMAVNMRPEHAEVAAQRGSWGVGRFYYRVLTDSGRIFDIYYDRAPTRANARKGSWILYREMSISRPEK